MLPRLDIEHLSADPWLSPRINRLVWCFIALGSVLRLVRYCLPAPLMVDECLLAENYLDRGFGDLLLPLGNFQVAPVSFLWIELALVKLLGFSQWSLRLFPVLCSIAGLFLFRHFASRLLSGVPLVLAVAFLAVAKAPWGLATDAKPYASDLLVAIALLTVAVEWLRDSSRTCRLWSLAALAPVALTLSFPAVFVAAAVSMGLFLPVCRLRNLGAWKAYGAFNALTCASFAAMQWINSHPLGERTRAFMLEYWTLRGGFPPAELAKIPGWLVDVHLGDRIFAIPFGAENGGGLVPLVCCIIAAALMYRRGQRTVLAIFLAAFGLAFVAALFRRYPYGGHIRLVQFLVPAISVTLGLGAASLLGFVARTELRRRLAAGLLVALALFGCDEAARRVFKPYDTIWDRYHQEFARSFWRDKPGTVTICALADLGLKYFPDGQYPYYRCNQRIYSPAHHAGRRISPADIDRLRLPVRLVVFRPHNQRLTPAALARCLEPFDSEFELAGSESHRLPVNESGSAIHGTYEVYHFTPRRHVAQSD